ncbi:MAG: tetratricopeptide repeat protein [Planctomycetes bacterium]|jgi:tetratricopeptide (TPR) repeat protein|nr:tetratricopeptide repeat protein [Planctomycetota bacterium]MCL4729025.1 tetratricopeptide repeat protein [Planctomycetota bacterium]
MRDAAYELQLPADRARLHELAFYLIEQAFGGRAPDPPPLDAIDPPDFKPHPTDIVAHELAEHARLALGAPTSGGQSPGNSNPRPEGSLLPALYTLYLHRAAEHAELQFRNDSATKYWKEFAALDSNTTRHEALRRAGLAANNAGDLHHARSLFEAAIDLAHHQGNRHAEGRSLLGLASVVQALGHTQQAEAIYREILSAYCQPSHRLLEGAASGNLAELLSGCGRFVEAEQLFLQALKIFQEAGHQQARAVMMTNLGNLYGNTGRKDLAERAYEQSLTLQRTLGDQCNEAVTLLNLGIAAWKHGALDRAERMMQEAIAIFRKIGNRHRYAVALANLGPVLSRAGRKAEAGQLYEQALDILRDVGARRFEGVVLGNLAGLYSQSGRGAEARKAYEHALGIHRETGHRKFEAAHLCAYAQFLAALGESGARQLWCQGAAILQQLGDTDTYHYLRNEIREVCQRAGISPFDESPPEADIAKDTPGPDQPAISP